MPPQKGKGLQKSNNTGKKNQLSAKEKQRLGLDRTITRRDFLKVMMVGAGSLMVGAGSLMLSRCSGVNSNLPFDPVSSTTPHTLIGGDSADNVAACHNFWWKRLAQKAEDSGEIYDLVIVGAGLGGLTAAFYYHQERPEANILLMDSHADFGGNAQRNEMTIKEQKIIVTQASDYQWAISSEYKMVEKLWKDLGIDLSPSSKLAMPAEASQEHLFVNGKWILDFWETGYYSASSLDF